MNIFTSFSESGGNKIFHKFLLVRAFHQQHDSLVLAMLFISSKFFSVFVTKFL